MPGLDLGRIVIILGVIAGLDPAIQKADEEGPDSRVRPANDNLGVAADALARQ